MTPPDPARLHVLLARDAPIGLVIRRGPSKRVCSVLWDRTTDTFQLGQWLKGRIHDYKCDISPDGKYWVYFALNGKWRSESQGAWTAIARVPYLKAIEFFPEGTTYGGGGTFTQDGHYWWRDNITFHRTPGAPVPHPSELSPEERDRVRSQFGKARYTGWVLVSDVQVPPPQRGWAHEKQIGGGWALRWLPTCGQAVEDPCREKYGLLHRLSSTVIDRPTWEWADVDGERVVWTERGKLFGGRMTEAGLADERLLHDFNPMTFEPIAAPY